MKNETSHDRPRYQVQEQLEDGFWYGIKLFAQKCNAETFARSAKGTVRITPLPR